jgi:hypothetical protein
MAIQISKYKRPGIFIEEYDKSIITSPVAQGLNTLVVGFSKKGPVNTPVLLTNTNDLTSIFGDIDRGLERKGSFFHRTITQMLASSPVYALNLLATDDVLDQIQYKSLSAATDKSNGVLSQNSYRKFFNTTGFWKRDTDAFLNITKSDADYNNVVLSLTNLSDKAVTAFVFKSQKGGFDVSLTQWYGSADQIPTYLNANDYASDYMVDVVIVAGDWSNYKSLAVDPLWSSYFNTSGLLIGQINNFANNRNVNLLAYYEGLSLIPYFRDLNGSNIFIETIINLDTDKTGVFCTFNIDLVESDFPTGIIDLVGNNLVNSEQSTIDFLSYQDTITQQLPYGNVPLDRPGNVSAIISASFSSTLRGSSLSEYVRSANYSEGIVSGVAATASSSSSNINYNLAFNLPYAVSGGAGLTIDTTTSAFSVATASYPTTAGTYSSALVLHSNGTIGVVNGTVANLNPTVLATDLVLGYSTVYLNAGAFSNFNYENVYVNQTGFNELVLGVDYNVSTANAGADVVVTFPSTAAAPLLSNYQQYRKIKYFNHLISLLNSPNRAEMTILTSGTTQNKLSLSSVSISNIVTSTLLDKSFQLSGLGSYTDISVKGNLVFYSVDDEFIVSSNTITTQTSVGTTQSGVVGRYSQFYLDYYNGNINDNDYMYTNFVDPLDSTNGGYNVTFETYGGSPYVIFQTVSGVSANYWPEASAVQSGDIMLFPTASLNTGALAIQDYTNYATTFGGSSATGMYAFLLTTSVKDEYLTGVKTVFNVNLKHYLKMFIDTSDILHVTFVDSVGDLLPLDLGPLNSGSTLFNELEYAQFGFDVFSDRLNYKESVDVVYPAGYISSPNKILVNSSRYTELVLGDFLEAYVDTTILQVGEVPRRLTRILSKKIYPADTTLVEITCDSKIAVTNLGTVGGPQWQTTRYKAVEDYITTYKAITLSGFRMRQASIPDGTEARQNQILNLVAGGTPLYNALINKDAIDFRYLIDSFGLGLISNSKQQLMDICGQRLDCLGFLNMPSLKQFAKSTNPSFTTNGVLNSAFIAAGGDISLNPDFLYTFGTGQGTSCVGYFSPYLTVSDNGRPLDLPPAMFVATTYMRKQNSNVSSIVPWTVAAGVTNGKVTGFNNVESDFTHLDIENLNGAQMNPIVYKRNRGFVIETENTAQTLYKSALSFIHVREVLIELERALSAMLLDFQWKFNTPDVRAEIKLRADVICEQFVNKNGLYNYFNKCDDENNTPDIIDNQIGVLDTYVEPIKAMGIIVNNITILRTGAIQSGGFIVA